MTENIEQTSEEGYTQPIYENGRFKNPWDTWTDVSTKKVFRFLRQIKDISEIPKTEEELCQTLPVHTPDFSKLENPPENEVQAMWIGHASILVQFDGITVITDPIFSDRCSPLSWLGPRRYRPTPCRIEELKKVDAIVISHNHYDHLDYYSVKEFNRCFGDSVCWFVPKGTKQWMEQSGCKKVVELTWWEEVSHPDKPDFTFALTPSQHWCKRGVFDTNKALWGSWVVKGPRHNFYFAGDTGYCSGFRQIGRKYGPFSLAAIPIGAYYPRWFMSPQHVNPEEAVMIHEDIKSQNSVGIHWGTFKMTYEPYLEPKKLLEEELRKKNMNPSAFVTLPHGDVHIFGAAEQYK